MNVGANYIFCQTKELSAIQLRSLEPVVLLKHGSLNPITQEGFFPVSFFDKLIVNMISCSEVEEEIGEEDGRQENSLEQTSKTLVALEAISMRLNWGGNL